MTDQALEDLEAILGRLIPGMSLRLDGTAFPHFFASSRAGIDAARDFAIRHNCLAFITEKGGEFCVEFLRPYASTPPDV
jgi:hypothetical protein